MAQTLRQLIAQPDLTVAPLVMDPLSARIAQANGFKAAYLGGGALGYLKVFTEANLSHTEIVQTGIDIRTACPTLPLILDGACGWGDPMHMHRTIPMAEAAGFQAIEIEDQILPKRVHHHTGTEHLIPLDLMVAKIRECKNARTNDDFLLIGRTNAGRVSLDDGLRRAEAMYAAGADMILYFVNTIEDIVYLAERTEAPQMQLFAPGTGLDELGVSRADMIGLGFRLIVDSLSPLIALHDAMQECYAQMASGKPEPRRGVHRLDDIHKTIGLDALLAVEKETVEKDS